jgi:hypothetical protein
MDIEQMLDLQVKYWLTLKEACELKGICYKTTLNRPELKPNHGKEDGIIGGRKMYTRQTVMEWVEKTDDQLNEQK